MEKLYKIVLFTLIFGLLLSTALAADLTTKRLDSDTKLHPVGWMSGYLEFKGGTQITLNERGEVIKGTLKNFEDLRPSKRLNIFINNTFGRTVNLGLMTFKGNTPVNFNERGEVLEGTLGEEALVFLETGAQPIKLQIGSAVSFNESGELVTCTLCKNTYLRYSGYENFLNPEDTDAGYILFMAEKAVTFNQKRTVTVGTLAHNEKFKSSEGGTTIYVAGTTVYFNDKGEVYKAAH